MSVYSVTGHRRGTLTATELVIADLAARGHRDTEIAAELGLSLGKVERTMSRIYRKLGVGSRAELLPKEEAADG